MSGAGGEPAAPAYWVPAARVRPKVACIIRRGADMLVTEAYDHARGFTYHCPPGGGIEFMETSAQCAVREMREELGSTVEPVRLLGVVENLYTAEGRPGHDIVFVWEVRPTDPAFLDSMPEWLVEDGGLAYRLLWRPLADVDRGDVPLFPAPIRDLIRSME